MESSIKDKYIILGFVGFAIVLISSIATLVIADSFNQDNFVRWIVFVCCNLLGWLLYLSFQTLIFDTYEIYKIKFGKKETIAEAIEVQEELSQNTLVHALVVKFSVHRIVLAVYFNSSVITSFFCKLANHSFFTWSTLLKTLQRIKGFT